MENFKSFISEAKDEPYKLVILSHDDPEDPNETGPMIREKAEELVKMYDGKRPKALDTFLKVLNMTEDEFYEIVEKHIVSPQKMPEKNLLKNSGSNIIPPDAADWDKKFI